MASLGHNESTHLPLDKMATVLSDNIFKSIFLNENDRIPIKFHKNLFRGVQLTIIQHWLIAEQATCHYLNQCWPSSLTHICSTRGRWGIILSVWARNIPGKLGQYHGCWCLGTLFHQGISSHQDDCKMGTLLLSLEVNLEQSMMLGCQEII